MPKSDDDKTEGAGKAETSSGGAQTSGSGGRSAGTQPGGNAARGAQPAGTQTAQMDAVALLKQDHRKVEGLFEQFENADDDEKDQLCRQICTELIIHTELEERIFYPAARQPTTERQLDEAQVEHDAAKVLILDLMAGDDEYRDAKVKVLGEEVKQHIREEEAPDGVLAKAQKAGVNTRELAERLVQSKQSLQQREQDDRLPTPQPMSFELSDLAREARMPRDYRDRDEYQRGGRSRDEEGRFTSSRSRYADDDRDRGHGGWYGDPRGHSEASRRGWEERRGESRSYRSREDDDDRRYASRGGSSRDRGQGGWFGDPEGHSEAAREGWDERRGEGRSYRSRDDDDRRYSARGGSGRDRGEGGWFGDPEGHSEAARRGWDEREERYGGGRRYQGRDDEGRFTSRRGWDERR